MEQDPVIGEHDRQPGYLTAMRAIHQRAADDLKAQRGDIKPARTLYAYYDSSIVLMKAKVLQWMKRPA